ncbi:hypothetical protein, partial [Streptomyces chartreusis]|uniref:hypothetical protein n=1 Tax=Streptomyces chartreusis TaxID=1969 RepID=UPI00381FDB5C
LVSPEEAGLTDRAADEPASGGRPHPAETSLLAELRHAVAADPAARMQDGPERSVRIESESDSPQGHGLSAEVES